MSSRSDMMSANCSSLHTDHIMQASAAENCHRLK